VGRSHLAVGRSWLGGAKLAVATGIAYLLAGQLSLMLRAEPGVAVFWPAAGIAVGALIALGPRARLPVAAAVVFGTVVCNVTIGRSPRLSIVLGFLNAGQSLFTAWLLEHWFGRTFKLEDVQQVIGFLPRALLDLLLRQQVPRPPFAYTHRQPPLFKCGASGSPHPL